MKSTVCNACLLLTVLVILGVCACYVRMGATADSVVVLKSSGMTCSRCTARVTQELESERGVAATEVDLERGLVIAGYDSKQVAPEQLARRVTVAGFASSVQSVLTPEQFKKIAVRDLGVQPSVSGCCGRKECCGK